MSENNSTFAPDFEFNGMKGDVIYRVPEAYIADIEILTGKSFRTAQRIMAKIKVYYNITGRKRPTIDQVKAYLRPER